jgi:hypothetical protein
VTQRVVLGAILAFIALLAFLTLYVLFESGPDVLVLVSLVVLAVFGVGVIGALATPPGED